MQPLDKSCEKSIIGVGRTLTDSDKTKTSWKTQKRPNFAPTLCLGSYISFSLKNPVYGIVERLGAFRKSW